MTRRRAWRVGAVLGAAAFWFGACTSNGAGGESESHFLKVCTSSTVCSDGLQCVCGVCTKLCSGNAACDGLPGDATCQETLGCEGPSACDVTCASTADCAALVDARVCSDGRCRSSVGTMLDGGRDASAPGPSVGADSATPSDSASSSDADVVGSHDAGSDVSSSVGGATVPFLEWSGGAVPLLDGGVAECCFPGIVRWFHDGDGSDVHELSDCGEYRRITSEGVECTSAMPLCGASGITPFDVAAAMNEQAVRDAVIAAPVTYGRDLRASGTAADVLSVDGHEIVIGEPCAGASGCVDAPQAVTALRDLLWVIGARMLGTGACRPDPGCYGAPDVGDCDGAFQRYYYDAVAGQCKTFTYGGCGGNDNKFETLQMCQRACDFDPCLLGAVQGEPVDAGPLCAPRGFGDGVCFDDPVVACLCGCQVAGNCDTCF